MQEEEKPPTLSDHVWSLVPPEHRQGVLEVAAPLVLAGHAPDSAVKYALAQVIHNNLLLRNPQSIHALTELSKAWGEDDVGPEVLRSPELFNAWKACIEVAERFAPIIADGADPVSVAFREKLWATSDNICVRCGEPEAPRRGILGIPIHPGQCEEDMKRSCAPAFRRIAKELAGLEP